jgi:hypothetical protein
MRSPYLVAFLDPLNLAMLALAAAAGLCSAWWLFPVGLLVWGLMLVVTARDPSVRLAVRQESRTSALSPRFQALFDEVSRSQVRLLTTLSTADSRTQAAFAPLHAEVEKLADEVYVVCQRMTGPQNFLKVSTMNSDLDGERALAVLAVESTADPKDKQEKQEALAAVEQRIRSVRAVESLLNRVETQLKTISNEMGAILAEIVRLQAMGAREAEKDAPALAGRIRSQIDELKSFQREAEQPR